MKMVWCHVKYTVLIGQLEAYFELMELVLFFYFTFQMQSFKLYWRLKEQKIEETS